MARSDTNLLIITENINLLQNYYKECLEVLRLTLRTILTCILRLHHSHELCLDPMNE